ncbi:MULTISPECIES: hypothetical protein [Rhodococcus]|uniref:hypothetical protein n=1 Tax=Rhodococcus TaxID=1827 RepID=UPI00193C2139|nr:MULTISPECIES: hypothetical protein [Rhodococcus]QRI76269.1 hypothetical protein JQ505_00090 [Rhodococcus aetherivorans]QSE59680.1 hypothetical protein JYA75_01205 [Rhodococcus sp. PSBB066]
MRDTNIRVDVAPDDAPLQFSPDCMDPILEWRGQMGWVLLYVEADGNNSDYYLGGALDDVEWALREARAHLADVELA